MNMVNDDVVPTPVVLPDERGSARLVYSLLQVLGCIFMALAGFSINLTVGLAVTGVGLLAFGVALERATHAR